MLGNGRYEIFLKAAELCSITKAAEALNYTQSGVSHAIAALERETGFPLFLRTAGGVVLTEDGRRLIEPIQKLVNAQKNVAQTISEINHVVRGTVRLAAVSSVTGQLLAGIMERFGRLYPLVEFEILDGNYDMVSEWIIKGKADCGFIAASAAEGLSFMPLWEDPLMAVFPREHPLAGRESVTVQEIAGESFIAEGNVFERDIRPTLWEQLGGMNMKHIFNSDLSVLAMVERGFGIGVMPQLVLRSFSFDVACVRIDGVRGRSIGVAYLPEERLSVLTKTFLQYLSQRGSIADSSLGEA